MTQITKNILTATAECFTNARRNVYEGAKLLYQINEEKLWESEYDSFNAFLEQDCQISAGYASKLIQSWKFYVVEGGLSQAKLSHVDAEKLYLALKLPTGSPEKRLTQALTLSRQELRAELAEDENGNEHTCEPLTICKICNKRLA